MRRSVPSVVAVAGLALLALVFSASPVQASVFGSKPLESNVLRQKRFAWKVSRPVVPMWQRAQWSLVDPVFRATRKTNKRRVALADVKKSLVRPKGKVPLHLKQGYQVDETALDRDRPRWVAEKLTKEEIAEKRREKLASAHQILGYTTLALLTATMVLGQINAVDFLSNRLSPQPMLWSHRVLSIATTATYLSTFILAMLMRRPPDEDADSGYEGFDSSRWHKILAWIHGIGMSLLVLGGILNAHIIPSNTIGKTIFTVSHLAIGYVTWLSLGAASIIITFY
ncbi:MAG: hypothetical protein EP343_31685 [Deltaproteobacteria bacterium]|nr:MAG: hypothetical protein EP343_31685 [Deltaproteobacteria bacterium]